MVLAQIILKNIVSQTNLAILCVFIHNGFSRDVFKGSGNAVTLNHLEPNNHQRLCHTTLRQNGIVFGQ